MKTKSKPKILVTGGSGFLGKTFIKLYRKDFDIVAPSHEQMDLLDARSVNKQFAGERYDAVLHLAGLSDKGKEMPLDADNLIMFKNIQYMSVASGVKKLIAVGEGVEFDSSRPIVDFGEDMIGESVPKDGYGLGKYLINALASKDKITTLLRIFNVYGVGGGLSRPINKMVAAAARGKKQIVVERDKVVSAISAIDAAKVLAAFLKNDYPRGDYNLVSGDKMSYVEMAKTLRRLVRKEGGDIEITVKNQTPDCEYSANNAKLAGTINFKLTPIRNGIKDLYAEMRY